MVAARSIETRSEQGAQGAIPKGANEVNCWAVRTGRTEQYRLWKEDLDHMLKINGQEDIETFLAVQPPDLNDELNPEGAAAKKRHAELLVAWMRLRVLMYDHIKSTLIIEGSHHGDDLKAIRAFEMSNEDKDAQGVLKWAMAFADVSDVESQSRLVDYVNLSRLAPGSTVMQLYTHSIKLWDAYVLQQSVSMAMAGDDRNAKRTYLNIFMKTWENSLPSTPENSLLTKTRAWMVEKRFDNAFYFGDEIRGAEGAIDTVCGYAKRIGVASGGYDEMPELQLDANGKEPNRQLNALLNDPTDNMNIEQLKATCTCPRCDIFFCDNKPCYSCPVANRKPDPRHRKQSRQMMKMNRIVLKKDPKMKLKGMKYIAVKKLVKDATPDQGGGVGASSQGGKSVQAIMPLSDLGKEMMDDNPEFQQWVAEADSQGPCIMVLAKEEYALAEGEHELPMTSSEEEPLRPVPEGEQLLALDSSELNAVTYTKEQVSDIASILKDKAEAKSEALRREKDAEMDTLKAEIAALKKQRILAAVEDAGSTLVSPGKIVSTPATISKPEPITPVSLSLTPEAAELLRSNVNVGDYSAIRAARQTLLSSNNHGDEPSADNSSRGGINSVNKSEKKPKKDSKPKSDSEDEADAEDDMAILASKMMYKIAKSSVAKTKKLKKLTKGNVFFNGMNSLGNKVYGVVLTILKMPYDQLMSLSWPAVGCILMSLYIFRPVLLPLLQSSANNVGCMVLNQLRIRLHMVLARAQTLIGATIAAAGTRLMNRASAAFTAAPPSLPDKSTADSESDRSKSTDDKPMSEKMNSKSSDIDESEVTKRPENYRVTMVDCPSRNYLVQRADMDMPVNDGMIHLQNGAMTMTFNCAFCDKVHGLFTDGIQTILKKCIGCRLRLCLSCLDLHSPCITGLNRGMMVVYQGGKLMQTDDPTLGFNQEAMLSRARDQSPFTELRFLPTGSATRMIDSSQFVLTGGYDFKGDLDEALLSMKPEDAVHWKTEMHGNLHFVADDHISSVIVEESSEDEVDGWKQRPPPNEGPKYQPQPIRYVTACMGCGNVHGTIYRDDLTIQPSYDMDPNTFRAEVYRCGACENWFCTDAGTCNRHACRFTRRAW